MRRSIIFSVSLENADEKAKRALYMSDMDMSEKESRHNRKFRAQKRLSTSESEEESDLGITLPPAPRLLAKRK